MTKKRNKLEVVYDLLRVIAQHRNSIKPTPLLRYANLSSQGFNEYITELLGKGLIQEVRDNRGRKHYSLTDKGFRYVEQYKTIVEFIDYFEL